VRTQSDIFDGWAAQAGLICRSSFLQGCRGKQRSNQLILRCRGGMESAVSSVRRCHDGCWYTRSSRRTRRSLHELGQGSPGGKIYPSGYPEAAPAPIFLMQSPSVVHEQEHRQVDESGEEARAAAVRSLAIPRARGQSSSEMPRAAQMAIEVGGASKRTCQGGEHCNLGHPPSAGCTPRVPAGPGRAGPSETRPPLI
jgi:hypothetical protein